MYLGYLSQDGVTKDIDYNRINARMNITSQINKYITLGLNASGYRGTKQDAWAGYTQVIQGISRSHPTDPVYDEDGNFKYVGVDNPVAVQGRDKTGWQKTRTSASRVYTHGATGLRTSSDSRRHGATAHTTQVCVKVMSETTTTTTSQVRFSLTTTSRLAITTLAYSQVWSRMMSSTVV